ncbi:hypothetical protein CY0110_19602 [Crocosphaera chwakensis CCY0110]|uniref:Uncharacterized protein n=1 Tax=Crocosphaera chwakensis CCY0110 TaxID=391612 RepID=A3IJQ2_9CHRO|nr:hypothetical protein CY0110_19602 [Crocosphaera chwakensis CCY0110]
MATSYTVGDDYFTRNAFSSWPDFISF